MKFNSITFMIAIGVLCITVLYVLVYSGLTGLLLTSAVALIIASFIQEFELVVAITVIFALIYNLYIKRVVSQFEGFEDGKEEKVEKVEKVEKKEVKGVEKPIGKDSSNNSDSANNVKNQVDPKLEKEVTTANAKVGEKFKDIEASEFKSATNTLFKLGQMPSEHEDGPKLDAGKTIMKAMSSFDPSTISAMTTDTKKLLETQKGLMSMLNQMRPVLADGKELLQTFSGMFGGNGSANGPFELGKI